MYQLYLYLKTWLKSREEGQDLAEYALLLALIALAVVAVLLLVGPEISDIFQRIVDALGNIPAP